MQASSEADTRRVLQANFLFCDLSSEELSTLLEHIWLENIPAGSTIVHEGSEARELFLIIEGGVNVTKAPGQFLSYLGRNGFFGEMALFSECATRTASCTATSNTTCAVIRKHDLEAFCEREPRAGMKIYKAMVRALSQRLEATSADLATLMKAHIRSQSDISSIVEKAKRKPVK